MDWSEPFGPESSISGLVYFLIVLGITILCISIYY